MTSHFAEQVFLPGQRKAGQEVRDDLAAAASGVATSVRSTYGPVGCDKLLVSVVGDVLITNDGATIVSHLSEKHPAARHIIEAAGRQDEEVGDGTTSVVLLTADLLQRATVLVSRGVHPTVVISGLRNASKKALKIIKRHLVKSVDELEEKTLLQVASTSMSSKIIGSEVELFSNIVVKAMQSVKSKTASGDAIYPVKAVSILKCPGRPIAESELLNGYGFPGDRASKLMPNLVNGAKIAMLDFDLKKKRLGMGIEMKVENAEDLEGMQEKESEMAIADVKLVLSSGCNVVMTTQGIDDLCMQYLVRAGVLAVRRVPKSDLKRIAKATGGEVVSSLASDIGIGEDEVFDASTLGESESVSVEEIGRHDHIVLINGCKNTAARTILLRGPNLHLLDEIDRSVHDSLCAVSKALTKKFVVAGGGAVETCLSTIISEMADHMDSKEAVGLRAFAESLLSLPKQLATNAALDSTDLIAALQAKHHEGVAALCSISEHGSPEIFLEKESHILSAPEEEEIKLRKAAFKKFKETCFYGLNVLTGEVRNNLMAGVLEPAISKAKTIKTAIDTVIQLLRVDERVIIQPPKQDPRQQHPGGGMM
ncbi:T-complex protein 1 subunit alpha [Aduncisulcus paluster]|uniref:T-complex protein 1 subunit alpha n=1 Tax=Aduncisulcus paluster TaxID=2918883 RepID=A0ABQ5JXQ4_9EUKA|nr:T-complex protein 1 subunit alpha [Aduncisulcus paluster]